MQSNEVMWGVVVKWKQLSKLSESDAAFETWDMPRRIGMWGWSGNNFVRVMTWRHETYQEELWYTRQISVNLYSTKDTEADVATDNAEEEVSSDADMKKALAQLWQRELRALT